MNHRRLVRVLALVGAVVGVSGRAGDQRIVERRLSSPPLFDSHVVTDPGMSAIDATSALFTGENRFVAAGPEHADAMLVFVDVVDGSVATVTAEALGVSGIGGLTLVRAGADGRVVAWHGESSQVVTISATGTAVERMPLGLPAGFMTAPWELAALGVEDGVAVLRQRAIAAGFGNVGGASYRQRVEFSLMRPGGDPEPVVQVGGAERVYLAVREDSARGNVETDVVFGETVFSAPLGADKVLAGCWLWKCSQRRGTTTDALVRERLGLVGCPTVHDGGRPGCEVDSRWPGRRRPVP